MSNTENSNSPTPMSGSENSEENLPMAISDSESSHETQSIPMSDSSINVHEPPLKRVRTMYNNINYMIQESLQQRQQVSVTTGLAQENPNDIAMLSQENPTDIAMPSQENPTDTAGSSQSKQPLFHLSFSFNHATHLKSAIKALCDPVLDNLELGRIDADVNGFNVTVQSSSNNVIAHLCLKTSDFSCTKAIENKIVNLHELDKKLTVPGDNSVCIIQDKGRDDLTFFAIGFDEVSVPLVENDAEIPKFPEMSHFCKAVVPDDHFSVMLNHLLQQAIPEVLVEIVENSEMLMMLMIKIEDSWKKEYFMLKAAERRGVEPEKSYSASFQWTNAQWLNKASDMGTKLEVSLHTEPRTYIVLSFKIKDVGYLEYMKIPIP